MNFKTLDPNIAPMIGVEKNTTGVSVWLGTSAYEMGQTGNFVFEMGAHGTYQGPDESMHPTFEMAQEQAAILMTELWNAGVRPNGYTELDALKDKIELGQVKDSLKFERERSEKLSWMLTALAAELATVAANGGKITENTVAKLTGADPDTFPGYTESGFPDDTDELEDPEEEVTF